MAKTEFSIALKLLSEKFKGGLNNVQKQLQRFKSFVISAFAGVGIAEFGRQMVMAGADFQNAMARVSAISKAATNDLKAMREEAMRLGRDTKYTATEAANALEMLVRNGLKPLQAKDALQGTLQLAQSQAIELSEAADIAVTAMNAFGLSTNDLGRINDVLAATSSNTATNVLELYEAFKVAAPVAHAAGISLEETATALGMLANRGFRGSDAGTGFKQIVLALASQTPEAAAILKKYGVQVNETELRTKGLIAVLRELADTGLGNSVADLGEFFNKLGAPKGAAVMADMSALEELYQIIANSQGEAARMFDEGIGEWEKAYKTLVSVWENTQIKVFEGGKAIFTEPLKWLAEFIRRIQDIPTVAVAAFGLLTAKLGSIFTKTNKELADISQKQYVKNLNKAQAELTDAQIAHAINNSGKNRLAEFGQGKDYWRSLQADLQGVADKYDLSTKQGKQLQGMLKNLDVVINSTNNNTKRYRRAISELSVALQSATNVARNTNIDNLQRQLQGVQREAVTTGQVFRGMFAKLGTAVATFGKAVYSFFGGWVGIVMTLVGVVGTSLVSAWRKSTQAVRDSKKAIGEAAVANRQLDTEFVALVNVLRDTERSSNSWKLAMEKLKREYPELIEQLKLEELSVNTSADAYKKLKQRIDDVITSQKHYNIEKGKQKAIEGLENDFATSKLFTKITDEFGKTYGKQNGSEYVGKIKAEEIKGEILRILKETPNEERHDKLTEYLTNLNNQLKTYSQGTASVHADNLIREFEKRYSQIDKLNELYPSNDVKQPITTQNIDKLLDDAQKGYELERQKVYDKADAQGWDESKTAQELAQIAQKAVDELTDKLQGTTYTDKKGDKQDALKYAKDTNIYRKLLQQAKQAIKTDTTDTAADNIKDAEKKYGITLAFIGKQKELNYIEEKEYNEKWLSALQTLISAYEQNADATQIDTNKYRTLLNARENLIKVLKEQEEAAAKAKENEELSNRSQRKADKLSKGYTNIIEGRGKESINKWDYFEFDSAFEGKNKNDEVSLNYLKEQLDKLQQLRADISDEEIEKAKELSSVGTNALLEEVNRLDSSITKLSTHVVDLEDKFQLNKAREEIRLMKKDIEGMRYDAVKETFSAIASLGETIQSFEGFSDMSGWEQFTTLTDSIFGTIDTIRSLIDTWQSLNEILELFGLKRQALQAIETGSSAANIAAVQSEAAAVVAAEGEKATATTAAQAEITAVTLAAKAAQIKAAQIAMAAESTAAYAAIPFGGVALAAAQIAEMQALIAAAAALPAFADGGIVGGTKYVGDQNIARVNSGEMILNGTQQKHLWNAISNNKLGGNSSGNVEFKIRGQELVGVLNNYNKKISKVR